MSLKPVLRAAFFARITGFSIATIYQRPPPSLKTSIFLKKSSTKYVFSRRKHSERQLMRFVRKSKIILKNDKSVVQVGELLFVPPPYLSFKYHFRKNLHPRKKSFIHSNDTKRKKKKDVKKKIADASRRGEKDRELETADDRILLVMPPPFVCF